MKVLVVDQDVDSLDLTTYALRREGYTVLTASDGATALEEWEFANPDIIILDVNLPHVDGFEVCRRIRQTSQTPIIMLTADQGDEDVVRGLQYGADDFVTRPFSAKQLTARIQAVLRRAGTDPFRQPVNELRVGDLVLDPQSHETIKAGEAIQLTPIEFRILFLLAMNPNQIILYSRLVEYAWSYDSGDARLLKTHVTHIRRKLRMPIDHQAGITAVPGVGYRWIPPSSTSSDRSNAAMNQEK
jgi:DNA-binding response OmpR family regulator